VTPGTVRVEKEEVPPQRKRMRRMSGMQLKPGEDYQKPPQEDYGTMFVKNDTF